VVGETVNVTGQSSITPVKVPSCRLSDELGLLFERAAFSDVTLVVGDRQFQAHKAILAGTSGTLIVFMPPPSIVWPAQGCRSVYPYDRCEAVAPFA